MVEVRLSVLETLAFSLEKVSSITSGMEGSVTLRKRVLHRVKFKDSVDMTCSGEQTDQALALLGLDLESWWIW